MFLYCTVGRNCLLCDGNAYMQTLMYMFIVFVCSILYVCNGKVSVRSTFLYIVDWYFCIHSAICDCFLI